MKRERLNSGIDWLFAGLIGSLVVAVATPAIAASGHTPVSDDGTEAVVVNYAASSQGVSGFAGLGTLKPGAPESRAEFERLLNCNTNERILGRGNHHWSRQSLSH